MEAVPEFCLRLGGFQSWATCMTKAGWAAWGQVIASFIAILIGAVVIAWQVHRQHQQQRDAHREEEVRKLKLIGAGILMCRVCAGEMRLTFEVPDDLMLAALSESAGLHSQISKLAQIAPLDFPDARAAMAVSNLAGCFQVAEPHLASSKMDVHRRNICLNALDYSLEFAEKQLHECLVDRQSDLARWRWTLSSGEIIEPLPPIPAGSPTSVTSPPGAGV